MRYVHDRFCRDGHWLDIVWHGCQGDRWEPSVWDLHSVNGETRQTCDPDLWTEVEDNARRPA